MNGDPLLFQYCQKIIVFSQDETKILLAKRKGERDYDGTYTFVGGKLETTDGSLQAGLQREKNEEIGAAARVMVCPTVSHNVYFQKEDGHHMVLPHYIAKFASGEVVINEEYSDYAWVAVNDLDNFEPKISNITAITAWAKRILPTITTEEWVHI